MRALAYPTDRTKWRQLTVWQPWVDLMLPHEQLIKHLRRARPEVPYLLPKNIENRKSGTDFRGPVLIHAGQKIDPEICARYRLTDTYPLVTAAIVGVVWLTDVRVAVDSWWSERAPAHSKPIKNLVLSDPYRFRTPISCAGFQGLRPPREDTFAKVLAQLDEEKHLIDETAR